MCKIMHIEFHFILGNRKNYGITSQWPVLAEPIHWIRFWSLYTNNSRCIVLRLSCNCSDSNLVFTATLLLIVLYITTCLSDSCSATFTPKFGCTRHSLVGRICKSPLCIKHKWRFGLADGALRLLFSDRYLQRLQYAFQPFPAFARRSDTQALLWRVDTEHLWTDGHHIQIWILL